MSKSFISILEEYTRYVLIGAVIGLVIYLIYQW